jgi:NitT/TauT family transport system substrate-binding protein
MQTKKFLAALATSTLLFGATGADAACDKIEKVTAVWLPIMQTTAYYVALEEKLFEKACI